MSIQVFDANNICCVYPPEMIHPIRFPVTVSAYLDSELSLALSFRQFTNQGHDVMNTTWFQDQQKLISYMILI